LNWNTPASLAVTVFVKPVTGFRISTDAWGINILSGSSTVAVTVLPVDCENDAGTTAIAKVKTDRAENRFLQDIAHPPVFSQWAARRSPNWCLAACHRICGFSQSLRSWARREIRRDWVIWLS